MQKVMIIVTVTPDSVDTVLSAVASAGGGRVGHYTHCAFTSQGEGRFKPDDDAQPHIGALGQINREPEIRIETFCPRTDARAVIEAIRSAHPYEEPVYYVVPLLDDEAL